MLNSALLIIFGYLLGSIPWGFLISKFKGVDIKKVGSGNIGGTNVVRGLGLKWGLLVGVLDVLKGVIPIFLATKFLFLDWQIAPVAIASVLGHIFPVWLNFKGGKGVATTVGVLFVLLGWQKFLILILIWLLILALFQIMSFTNLLLVSFLPLILWFNSFSLAYFILGLVLFALIWWTHRENIQRLREGREPKFKLSKTT
ncbi:MAG TPA: glycerol-3-phosphate 1-O-acyltransferase PlsY [Candidatus Humimicrobiaceae bacterium]|nr:glycerol-3-phosphate 1-O-acyltransferase PlsY [Candidatus Humimicrobiaceae bacterium]